MEFNLINPIAERKTKTVYRDGDKTIKLFVENYSKADILNEALIQSRVEENTDLKISRLQLCYLERSLHDIVCHGFSFLLVFVVTHILSCHLCL